MSSTIVMKIGSSVLQHPRAFERAALALHARVSSGQRVVAVVSARPGVTDALVALARQRHAPEDPGGDAHAAARLVACGEIDSVRRLGAAVRDTGLAVALLGTRALGLRAAGSPLDASPACCADGAAAIDRRRVERSLERASIVIVPGFAGVDERGAVVLLGRGGSDLTALVVARALGATCRLVKDVDGLYERDPNERRALSAIGGEAVRFARACWDTAVARGGALVQPKAIHHARAHGQSFEIGALLEPGGTIVGEGPSILAPRDAVRTHAVRSGEQAVGPPRVRVALLGLGAVGAAVWRRLQALEDRYEVVAVGVRRPQRPRIVPDRLVTTDLVALLDAKPEVLVEVAGDGPAIERMVLRALRRGIHVVTANKALLARKGACLRVAAARGDARIGRSAAVGGGVPILETIETVRGTPELGHGRVDAVTAVLNGTTSFVLDRIGQGDTLDGALAAARRAGLVEADSSRDLRGLDAADKLVLVAEAAFGQALALPPAIAGVEDLADSLVRRAWRSGRRVRLVAEAWRGPGGVHGRVEPCILDAGDALARGRGPTCGVRVRGSDGSTVAVRGLGAGGGPTSAAIVADLERMRSAVESAARVRKAVSA